MSGACNYEEHCIATKNEERRLVELEKGQQYERSRQKDQLDTLLAVLVWDLVEALMLNKLVNPGSSH